jgi:hypothetical protein
VTLPLIPRGGDAARRYTVEAELRAGATTIARQRADSGYVADELREVRLLFADACTGLDCGDAATCRAGGCRSACALPVPLDAEPMACALDATSCDDVNAEAEHCDGFEHPLADRWGEGTSEPGGTLTVVPNPAHRGSALCITSDGPRAQRYVLHPLSSGFFPTARGGVGARDLFVRLYVRLPAGEVTDHVNVVYAGGMDFGGLILAIDADGHVRARDIFEAPIVELDGGLLPRDEWVCIEGHVGFTDPADDVSPWRGALELWVSEVAMGRRQGHPTAAPSTISRVIVGIADAGAAEDATTLCIDEVVISERYVGCD